MPVALSAVLLVAAAFYVWTASTSYPLEIYNSTANPYNQLAGAFLHFHLSLGRAPAELLNLPNPYDPTQNARFAQNMRVLSDNYPSLHDYALYHEHLFLIWGPAPALVLAPFHLLGFEPSTSLMTALFSIAGLGFALAALRVLLKQLGDPPLWICVTAALVLTFGSAIPFILRRPDVYEVALSGGFCFMMAGTWLAFGAVVRQRVALSRALLMSLCFGMAMACRPTLAVAIIVLIAVYITLRPTRVSRGLIAGLAIPAGACLLALMAYNQARYGSPLEIGAKYQLAGFEPKSQQFGSLSYVPPGSWYYLLAPPRVTMLFPFIALPPPPTSYPLTFPAHYTVFPEVTGGLLPMAPILLLLPWTLWAWRRRPGVLGGLAMPLLGLALAGLIAIVFLAYESFSTTERYEVDFSSLLLWGALAGWLVLATDTRGRTRRLVRVGGALLAAWTCLTGFAISFVGYFNLLAIEHPQTWSALETISSPITDAMSTVVGHPVLADVETSNLGLTGAGYTKLGVAPVRFWLTAAEAALVTIVSPDRRTVKLVIDAEAGPALAPNASFGVQVLATSGRLYNASLPPGKGHVEMRLEVHRGVNRFKLSAAASATQLDLSAAQPTLLLEVKRLTLAAG